MIRMEIALIMESGITVLLRERMRLSFCAGS